MKISLLSKIMLLVAALLLAGSVHVPIWQIDLDAPQYPEGLKLLISADAIGGDVEIINGLNHYIGMKTLHTDDFFEFTILPYLLYGLALITIAVMFIGRKKLLYSLLVLIVLFGVVSMIDFWRWEYDYGHNLDPNAAIIVPGMAYQPPLIGFKQLLNFGAYSIPTIGGWFIVGSGMLILAASVMESGILKRFGKKKPAGAAASMLLLFIVTSCSTPSSRPIQLNRDNCAHCKMAISDLKFSAEVVNKNGKVFTFDDISCLLQYIKDDPKLASALFYVADFAKETSFLPAQKAWYVNSDKILSPMGGNTAAFELKEKAEQIAAEFEGTVLSWDDLQKK